MVAESPRIHRLDSPDKKNISGFVVNVNGFAKDLINF